MFKQFLSKAIYYQTKKIYKKKKECSEKAKRHIEVYLWGAWIGTCCLTTYEIIERDNRMNKIRKDQIGKKLDE